MKRRPADTLLPATGLNKLSGFGITSLSIQNQGLIANIIIPNASPLVIELV